MVKKVNRDKGDTVLELFLEKPEGSYHVREAARLLSISPRTAKKYLAGLTKDGLLLREKAGIYEKYRANRQSQEFKDRKVFHTIRRLRECGIIEFLETKLNYPAIVLYGSAARGEDDSRSDIDLFVVTKTKAGDIDVGAFAKKLGHNLHVITMSEDDLRSGKNKELINNALNGIVVSGFVEVFR
ncbi:MAG: nucleotidyltransferase domain-containing protein [Candidatus Aenigmarchaeota archaeon]|nr:nucleotidyltransferase domain-containing protein [Candidatus Aenigmarchaeota archaeon]